MIDSNQLLKKTGTLLTWLIILFPVFIAFFYFDHGTVNIPYYDEWGFVPFVTQWYEGKANWWIIFQPDRHYVVALQKAVILLSAKFFHWNIRIETGGGLIMLSGIASVFMMHARRIGIFSSTFLSITFLLPVLLSLFSLRQSENLLGPWGLSISAAVCFVMLACYFLTLSNQLPYFLGASICALLASFSFTNGLLIWPLGFAILLIQKRTRYAMFWMVMSILFLIIFFKFLYLFIPYTENRPPVPLTLNLLSQRFFSLLGGALSIDKYIITAGASGVANKAGILIAEIMGGCLFVLSLFLLWIIRKNIREYIIPISGILLSVSSCIMIAYLRANNGADQALASRYSIQSILFIVSIFVIIFQLSLQQRRFSLLKYGLLTIITVSMSYSIFVEMKVMPYRRAYQQSWANKVHDYSKGSDLTNPHYTAAQIYDYAAQLDKMKMTVFKEKN